MTLAAASEFDSAEWRLQIFGGLGVGYWDWKC